MRSSLIQGIIFKDLGVLNRVRVQKLWRHAPVDRGPKYPPGEDKLATQATDLWVSVVFKTPHDRNRETFE